MRRYPLALTALLSLAALGGCGSKNASADASLASATGSPAPAAAALALATAASPAPAATLALATADVSRVAPALDTYFRTNGYPATLEEVAGTMPKANLTMDPADALAGYNLDAAAKKFRLCVENDSGAWATYDTSSNSVGDHGLTGGCPKL
jgi:hypothetical protein